MRILAALLVSFEEAFQLPDPRRMTHLPQGFGLNLADAFASDAKLPANLFQCPRIPVDEPETLLEHLPLALGQGIQHVANLFLEERDRGDIAWVFRGLIGNEVAGCWAILSTARTRSTGRLISSETSSGVGSRP